MTRPAVSIIAEIGSTHDGSLGLARNSAMAALAAGATAAKFQTHLAAAETIRNAPAPAFFNAEPRFEYFLRTAFAEPEWRTLADGIRTAGGHFVSSPFSIEAVALLDRVGVDAFKIPSGEITNLPMIAAAAATGRPIILSSGMTTWAELDAAVDVVRRTSAPLTVLQCTTEYPCSYEKVGLNVMVAMRARYGCAVGLSDHTSTPWAAIAAVMAGADVIEKHFTLSRSLYGSDAAHSMEPGPFAQMVDGIRAAEIMRVSSVDKDDVSSLAGMRTVFLKSIVSTQPIAAGTQITEAMLAIKKPGTGIAPARLHEVLGCRALVDIPADQVIDPAWIGWASDEAQRHE